MWLSMHRVARGALQHASARSYSTQAPRIRHLTTIGDLSSFELSQLVSNATFLKRRAKLNLLPKPFRDTLDGKTVAMVFNKRSTRTRVSTEAAVKLMRGHPMFLGKDDIQLGVNESLQDTARVISSMTSCIVARVGPHEDIVNLAKYSSVPVINALSDNFHPLQAIADIMTLSEVFHKPSEPFNSENKGPRPGIFPAGLKVAWVGDANNVLFDLAIACIKLGADISVATPPDYRIPETMLAFIKGQADLALSAGTISEYTVPEEAVKDADVIFTDTWISMGQEEEAQKKLEAFAGFQVTEELAKRGGAKPDWKFMHCLPRHPEEVSDEVMYGPRSLVFQEAENRLWAAAAAIQRFVSEPVGRSPGTKPQGATGAFKRLNLGDAAQTTSEDGAQTTSEEAPQQQ
ncbi:putative ornithine carbamoyl transferase [Nemania sp. NC0429]|nr:putative ornithine carbamoyl transferase [Nemania sp. NC0429]